MKESSSFSLASLNLKQQELDARLSENHVSVLQSNSQKLAFLDPSEFDYDRQTLNISDFQRAGQHCRQEWYTRIAVPRRENRHWIVHCFRLKALIHFIDLPCRIHDLYLIFLLNKNLKLLFLGFLLLEEINIGRKMVCQLYASIHLISR